MAGGRLRPSLARLFAAPPSILLIVTGAFGVVGTGLGIVASFFGLASQFGLFRVLAGTVIGILIAFGVLAVRHVVLTLQDAEKRANAAESKRDELDHQLAELVVAQRFASADEPRAMLADDRLLYERALAEIADRALRTRILHKSIVVYYIMGEKPDGDEVREEYVTCAADEPEKFILWYEVRMSANGDEVPSLTSFRDLKSVKSYQRIGNDIEVKLLLVPIAPSSQRGGHRALAIFRPKIGVEPRYWGWSYRWPVFSPLRAEYQDRFGFHVYPGLAYDSMEIHVVFPDFVRKPLLQPDDSSAAVSASPNEFSLQARRRGAPWEFVIKIPNPTPGFYGWVVNVEGFDKAA
ncbi:MAG TPA: hypothetical protein VIA06_16805 [Candidatus Dormibacteraeota bacterium]|jgi:hypothetical protein|nr:hypothetical protein [Candidatus Dormibacteraeota bacterium]